MVSIGGSGHINDQLRHRRARAEQTQNSKANPWRGRRLPPEAGTAMCSFLHKSLRWECNRETRQIHEKKSVARALYFRPPSSTGATGGNRGSTLSPLPLLPPVQKSQRRSLTPNDEREPREAAAPGSRMQYDRNGCLPLAPRSG